MKNNFRQKFALGFILMLASIFSFAQSDNPAVGIGKWRIHLPYNNVIAIAEGNGKIYCASRYGLFSYDKNDGALARYSRVTGLNDLEIGTIRYNSTIGVLVIAYQSSNIDLLYDNGLVVNLSDIKRKNIVGGKSINHVMFVGKLAYLSCNFGIVVMDLERQEIKDTYYIGHNGNNLSVNQLATDGTNFYAATDSGLLKANAANQYLYNYESWTLDTTVTNAISNSGSSFSSVAAYYGKIYAVKRGAGNTDTLIQNDGTSWTSFSGDHTDGTQFETELNHLIRKNNSSVEVYDNTINRVAFVGQWYYTNATPMWGYVDNAGVFWIADNKNGLVKYSGSTYEYIYPNGPGNIATWAMAANKENLWVASGGINLVAPRLTTEGVYFYNDYNNWKSFNRTNDPLYASLGYFSDMVCVAADTNDTRHAFVGSWGSGLLEYRDNGAVKIYNESNSTLRAIADSSSGYRPVEVGGLAFDKDKNLWVSNSSSYEQKSLSVLKTDGSWQSFRLPTNPNLAQASTFGLIVDSYGQKWLNARSLGLGVFYENDMANPNDDSIKILTSVYGNGNLPSINTLSMAEDKDGAIWVGSDKGVAVIYNPGNVFVPGANYDAQKVLLEQDGKAQYLLENENVWAIAIDGANRKWFGTLSGGAFLMSADGTKQLLHFDSDNSPLLSNFVLAIAIDPNSGEVFFATDKGICSYRSDATEGGEVCDNYYVFPNPIKHDYAGPIAIKGLVANASVKITDVSGQLVYQTKANGGEAIWNGKNFKGEKAHTGVYTVFITNEDGSATCTTKMLFVN